RCANGGPPTTARGACPRMADARSPLLAPGAIAGIPIRNRIVAAPIERNYADADGVVTDRLVEHYRTVARGGAGWIDVEATFIAPEGRGAPFQLGIGSDAHVPGLRRLVDAIHA